VGGSGVVAMVFLRLSHQQILFGNLRLAYVYIARSSPENQVLAHKRVYEGVEGRERVGGE